MKLLILSTHPTILKWKNLSTYLKVIQGALPNFTIKILPIALPDDIKVIDGRLDRVWLETLKMPYFNQGYDIIGLHLSVGQWNTLKLQSNLNGSNPRRTNELGDFYFKSDEKTLRRRLPQFVQTLLHELLHEYFQQTKLPDKTHEWHSTNPDIVVRFPVDWSKYQVKRMGLKKWRDTLLTLVATLTKNVAVKTKPVTLNNDLLPLVKRQADKVLVDMEMLGHQMRIVQGYRSVDEQNKLYAQGRTTPGPIVTNAKGGESFHNYGVACDFVFRKYGYEAPLSLWQTLGAIGQTHGFEWGGDWQSFKDYPHLEMKLGHKLSDFQKGLVDLNKYK